MKTKKSVFWLLLSVLLVTGLLFTGCPGGDDDDEVIVVPPPEEPAKGRQVNIAGNPASKRFTLSGWNSASDEQKTLTVVLSETTKATYRWYSRTTLYSDETLITGATASSYLPPITAIGDYYYYVIVDATFIDEETGEETTKELISKTAYIQILADDDPLAEPAPTEFAIGDIRLNYVRGVGGTGSFMFRAGNGDASPDADVEYIDLLMGELGANILRIMVQDAYEEYITGSIQSKNVNQFPHDPQRNFFAVIRRVNELGGYVFANPWTAPASMKTINSLIGTGNYLKQNGPNYVDYAEHLRSFLKWLNANKAPIFAVGILNEPDFGQSAGYEGMGMNGSTTRDWFKTVGNFTTQKVTNRSGAGVDSSLFEDDIIPGYGGGGPTHHVLAMSGDSMGDIAAYMDSQINDAVANNNIELMGRHYYAANNRFVKITGSLGTPWENRPQTVSSGGTAYVGRKEAEALAQSPQMYAPGSTAGNIKREIWQTEHDINMGSSTQPPASNAQTYWNCVFGPLNEIDCCLRLNGESVYDWWYSSSYSGFVTSYSPAGFAPHTITPRGRAFAHYARYVNETWYLPIERTRGTINFNTPTSLNAGNTAPIINAFEDVNGKFISVVMFTPAYYNNSSGGIGGGATANLTDNPTNGSTNVGRIAVVLPDGFTAIGATAIRSYGHAAATGEEWDDIPTGMNRYWIDEPVFLYSNAAGNSVVEVTLPGGNVISIMVKGTWPGRTVASPERVRPYTVN